MNYNESTLMFDCCEDSLVGIVAEPEQLVGATGVIIVVGGPQYRAGSHRHFVLQSRELAAGGIPCLRFDCRGMGDSTGDARPFTAISDDIRAAADTFLEWTPGIRRLVLWGLCDGATAAAFYAAEDSRISGLVLLNPWVHTERAEARVYLQHYYLDRLSSGAFWRKVLQGQFNVARGFHGLWQMVNKILPRARASSGNFQTNDLPLPDRLFRALTHRSVKALFVLSEKDFVANEFENLVRDDHKWRQFMDTVEVLTIADADHTFSDPPDAARVSRAIAKWVQSL